MKHAFHSLHFFRHKYLISWDKLIINGLVPRLSTALEWGYYTRMDVDELIKEYAAVEAVAEDILSDKQQVKKIFSESTVSLAIYVVSLLADCWFRQQMEQRKRSTTSAEKPLPKCEEWWYAVVIQFLSNLLQICMYVVLQARPTSTKRKALVNFFVFKPCPTGMQLTRWCIQIWSNALLKYLLQSVHALWEI